MGQVGSPRTRFSYEELDGKINKFLTRKGTLQTPAHAAESMGITLRTLYNYRTNTECYGNETYGLDDDRSFKSLVDGLYTTLEIRILEWMAIEPKARTTMGCTILNKHFGYRTDEDSRSINIGTVKFELSPEMQRLAE